jgi:hypothetical protein
MSRIAGYEQDAQGHWSAAMDCGHIQPIRHRPPYRNRPWVLTAEGRANHIGRPLNCRQCNEGRGA